MDDADILMDEAIRGFLLEKHLPFSEVDAWADEIMRIVREHRPVASYVSNHNTKENKSCQPKSRRTR